MSTDFLYKKYLVIFASVLSLIFTFCTFGYAYFLSSVHVENSCGQVFFLVSKETNVEVGAEFVRWQGGAGYLLSHNGEEYVAMSVYFNENDGTAVQTALLENGKDVQVLKLGLDKLYFKTHKEKKNANTYLDALRIFYGYLQVFERGISLLEQSTQERVKEYYQPLQQQIAFLSEKYIKVYPSFSKVCKDGADALRDLGSETLYVKDLRYLLCKLSKEYVVLTSAFSL